MVYWKGDEMIRLLAKLVVTHCDPQRDFVGHVGGRRFSGPVPERGLGGGAVNGIISEFAIEPKSCSTRKRRLRGGIDAEDRHGVMRFFPLHHAVHRGVEDRQ